MTTESMTIEIKQIGFTEFQTFMESDHQDHVAEIQSGTYSLSYNPCWDTYEALYREGQLLALMAFDDGVPVGYLTLIASPCVHAKDSVLAVADHFYVKPAYRRSGVMRKLVSAGEDLCRSVGVHSVSLSVMHKLGGGSEFVESLGYEPAEVVYTKVLK